jgi:hypothetical protein
LFIYAACVGAGIEKRVQIAGYDAAKVLASKLRLSLHLNAAAAAWLWPAPGLLLAAGG